MRDALAALLRDLRHLTLAAPMFVFLVGFCPLLSASRAGGDERAALSRWVVRGLRTAVSVARLISRGAAHYVLESAISARNRAATRRRSRENHCPRADPEPESGLRAGRTAARQGEVTVQRQLSTSLQLERCPHCAFAQPQLARVTERENNRRGGHRRWGVYECLSCVGLVVAAARAGGIPRTSSSSAIRPRRTICPTRSRRAPGNICGRRAISSRSRPDRSCCPQARWTPC